MHTIYDFLGQLAGPEIRTALYWGQSSSFTHNCMNNLNLLTTSTNHLKISILTQDLESADRQAYRIDPKSYGISIKISVSLETTVKEQVRSQLLKPCQVPVIH